MKAALEISSNFLYDDEEAKDRLIKTIFRK